MDHRNMKVDLASYIKLLKQFIETQDEVALYEAEQMSKQLLQQNFPPEEIVNLHNQAIVQIYPDLSEEIQHTMDFLLEVMIAYGFEHQEISNLREEQVQLKSEIAIAANMQQTLLETERPKVEGLDIGVISVPAGQMNGDYYHFVPNDQGAVGIALADVIGKGVPAALCMSMIKYAMDSFPKESMMPSTTLANLNRVIERNVEIGMFITMFYAQYLPENSLFRYASAGHEPGFYYSRSSGTFTELKTKGLVLGVMPDSVYRQYELKILDGDMIILLTDGVTECRKDGRFLEREEVLAVIQQYIHLPAQKLVEQVYKHFERLQDFHLRDDFTLMILQKGV